MEKIIKRRNRKPLSEETKTKISKSLTGRRILPIGYKHSKEIRTKMKIIQSSIKYELRNCLTCNGIFEPNSPSQKYCVNCREREYKKLYILAKKTYKKNNKIKVYAVARANYAVKVGKIFKKPCSICGSRKSEKHHPDYTKPLNVIWLCDGHHKLTHRKILQGLRTNNY